MHMNVAVRRDWSIARGGVLPGFPLSVFVRWKRSIRLRKSPSRRLSSFAAAAGSPNGGVRAKGRNVVPIAELDERLQDKRVDAESFPTAGIVPFARSTAGKRQTDLAHSISRLALCKVAACHPVPSQEVLCFVLCLGVSRRGHVGHQRDGGIRARTPAEQGLRDERQATEQVPGKTKEWEDSVSLTF